MLLFPGARVSVLEVLDQTVPQSEQRSKSTTSWSTSTPLPSAQPFSWSTIGVHADVNVREHPVPPHVSISSLTRALVPVCPPLRVRSLPAPIQPQGIGTLQAAPANVVLPPSIVLQVFIGTPRTVVATAWNRDSSRQLVAGWRAAAV